MRLRVSDIINKTLIKCPKCSTSRKKNHLHTCSVIQFSTGLSYKCFHCGYKEFVAGQTELPEGTVTSDKITEDFLPIPEGAYPFEDKDTKFYKYYKDGQIVFYIARKGEKDNKFIRPYSLTESQGWVMTKPNVKVLYASEILDPAKPTLVVEGEEACDAARKMFTKFNVVTWHGGSNNYKAGDWELLSDMKVLLWADNDEAGVDAMKSIAKLIDSKEVYICDVSRLKPKEDLADLILVDEAEFLINKPIIVDIISNKVKVNSDKFTGEFDPSMLASLHGEKMEYIPFGWDEVDKYVKIPPTGVVVISGRTNHGKSNLMLNMALNIAKKTPKTVLYLTLEFPINELNIRMVKCLDGTTFSTSGWEDDQYFNKAIAEMSLPAAKEYRDLLMSRKLRVADRDVTIDDIIKVMDEVGEDLVLFVDYLQIIPLQGGSGKARYEQLKDMIEKLRNVANKNKQVIVGGSQLTNGESPYTDTVRESKDLENTAALHLKIWNKDKARTPAEGKYYENVHGQFILIVEKSRQMGANGKAFGFSSPNGCVLQPAKFNEELL